MLHSGGLTVFRVFLPLLKFPRDRVLFSGRFCALFLGLVVRVLSFFVVRVPRAVAACPCVLRTKVFFSGGWTRVPLATPSSRCPRAPSFCCALALRPKVSASGGLDACALGHALPPLSLLRALRVPACLGLFQREVGCVCRWPRLPPAVVARPSSLLRARSAF